MERSRVESYACLAALEVVCVFLYVYTRPSAWCSFCQYNCVIKIVIVFPSGYIPPPPPTPPKA